MDQIFQVSQLQGWIKLDLTNINFLETIVFRITINYNYNDDIYIDDREVLLKYFQSSIPGENGFEISTQSYSFPLKTRYITEDDDKISVFGDQYSSMFVTWHYFQFEFWTLNNNGQPLFTLHFPSLNQYYKYVWSKLIKHFTGVTYLINIGGIIKLNHFFKVMSVILYLYNIVNFKHLLRQIVIIQVQFVMVLHQQIVQVVTKIVIDYFQELVKHVIVRKRMLIQMGNKMRRVISRV